MVVEKLYVNVRLKLTLGVIQLFYLDRKVFLELKLVLSVLGVTHICHVMLKWKEREPYFEIFRGYNVFAKKTLILVTV